MPFKDLKYKYDQTILKVYGYGECKKIKLIRMNCLRTAGIFDDSSVYAIRGTVNDSKLSENLIRAKEKIFELAFCNPWDYFFTATLDPKKYNRTDLEKFHKDLTQWFRNQGKKLGCKIDFLLIPELHLDGQCWHMHGFIHGLPFDQLRRFKIGDVMGKAIADKVKKGEPVFDWPSYRFKFGWCDLEPIRSAEAISKYITKYITKNLANCVSALNAHLYYHSRGLKTAQVIKKGAMAVTITPTYENEYCSVSWLDYSDDLLQNLLSSFVDIDYYNTRKHI